MSQISNILALIWLDCAVIVDNEGIQIYFVSKKKIYEDFPWFQNEKTRRAFRFDLVIHDTDFITEKPRCATGVEPAIPGIQTVCVRPRATVAWLGIDGWTITPAISIALIFFYRVEWGKTPTLNFNGTYLVDYCFLRQFEGMVGDGLFNSLSTYNISQICNVSRYTKFVQNLCKNLAPVLSLQKM